MKNADLNNLLRTMVFKLSHNGWAKSNIGKILLGTSGQAQLVHWLKDEENPNDFGIKPLQKIGSLLNYTPHVVFIKDDDQEMQNILSSKNVDFCNYLEQKIHEYLSNNISDERITKKSKGKIDKFIENELLGFEIFPTTNKVEINTFNEIE
jgi:hypothetical protein